VANILLGVCLFIVGFAFEILSNDTRAAIYQLGFIFRLWPVYALGEGLWRIVLIGTLWKTDPPEDRDEEYYTECEKDYDEDKSRRPYECARTIWDRKYATGDAILYLCAEILLYFL